MPASQAVVVTAVIAEVSAMHRKNHRNNKDRKSAEKCRMDKHNDVGRVNCKEYPPVKNNYQQVKNMKKVVDILVSLR